VLLTHDYVVIIISNIIKNESLPLMESVRELLCDHISMDKIIKRAKLIAQQLHRDAQLYPVVEQVPHQQTITCVVCGNTNEQYTIIDDNQGTLICLGCDGLGCGNIIHESKLTPASSPVYDTTDNINEIYSPQNQFFVRTTNHNHYKRLTQNVEKNLIRYGRDDTVTSDAYKDDQRREVYELLDHVEMYTDLDINYINAVKVLFHEFRTRMYRIHKLEMAVCCLIYIVLNST
jgi:hypothetical protein